MKNTCLAAFALAAALLLAGCGPKDAAPAAPAPAPAGPRVIALSAADNMRFSDAALTAKPGEPLKVTLSNLGTLPKAAMAHNWVLLKAGVDANAFSSAVVTAKDTDYIPPALQDQMVAHTALLGPHETAAVEFTAPTAPGDYTFLCSFPAHYQVGMKGILTVK